jgi:arabinose-5-phosphate isomerase
LQVNNYNNAMNNLLAPRAATDAAHTLSLARQTLMIEADAVAALASKLGDDFIKAHQMCLAVSLQTGNGGRVVVTGMGKSGHIGGKIASTLASTGTPAFYMHPGEASHGDLGMITKDDVVIALSNSGESAEILSILPILKRRGTKLIAMTGNATSTLARAADAHLYAGVAKEACPLNLAPTASTTAALALGDALAVALLDARGFREEDFASHHPGGALGRRLLVHVRDVMVSGEQLPSVSPDVLVPEAISEMSRKAQGMTAVCAPDGTVLGVFSDGDLRRAFATADNIKHVRVGDVMTKNPKTIGADKLAVEAAALIEQHKIGASGLLVVDGNNKLIGALQMLDLMRAGVL